MHTSGDWPPVAPDPQDQELLGLTASQACARLQAGELGAREYLQALLRQQTRLADLHGFIEVDAERALHAASLADQRSNAQRREHALHGLPLAVKDNIDVVGLPTTAGSPALAGHVPSRSASVVARLQAQGAVVMGKNNLHEFALGITSRNGHYGAVRNPWSPDRIAGGSSGGTAAVVAARIVPAGLGTDTGGSVRIPSALCGVVGWRPSTGRWATDGVVPISRTRDTIGPLARSVADCALLDTLVCREASDLPALAPRRLRIGVPRRYFWANLGRDIGDQAEQTLQHLTQQGIELVSCDIDDGSDDLSWLAGLHIAMAENLAGLRDYWASHGLMFDAASVARQVASPDVARVFAELLQADEQLGAQYQRAMSQQRPALQAAYRRCLVGHQLDAIAFPATPLPAAPIGEDELVQWDGRAWPTFPTYTRNANPATVAGAPGISLPAGLVNGLPWGLELDGLPGQDRHLLAVALAVEASLPPAPVCPLA